MIKLERYTRKSFKVKAIPCEVFSRVTGYYRPVLYWNTGKKQEFKERKYLKIKI